MGPVVFLLLFLFVPNAYAAGRLYTLWPWASQNGLLFWTLAALFLAVQLAGPFGERLFFPQWRQNLGFGAPLITTLNWAAYVAYGLMSVFVFYTLVGEVVRILWRFAAPPDNPVDFDRRMILTLGGAALATAAIGVWQAVRGPTVKRAEVPLENLPESFDGFTIAQVSDLHCGPTIKRPYTQNVVNIVNGLNPDMVALTGDFVDGTIPDLARDVAPLADLRSTHGSFYITGNHEYYWGAEAWMVHFKTLGLRVLANEHEIIRNVGGDGIVVAGVNDYSTLGMGLGDACNPAKSIEGAPQGLVKILLAHQPVTFTLAEQAGFDLQLSGHTHAGQYFPFNLLIRFFQRFYKGLNRYKNMWIYVNTATGYWGPPLRAGVPTEITLLTLRRKAAPSP